MSKKEKVTEKQDAAEEKVMTRYDRRVQKRKEQEEKEKREQKIGMTIGILVVAALVCLIASFPIRTYLAVNETFVEIDGKKVTRVEFDYNYNINKNNYLNQYGSYLSYFGVDPSADLSQQMYSDTMTWEDFFQEMTVDNIIRNKALLAEASASGFTHDTAAEYKEFETSIKAAASEQGMSLSDFLKANYGPFATMGRLQGYIKDSMVSSAYYEKIAEEKKPAEDAIVSHYEENKNDYDSVDYRMITVNAELPTEPTELADPVDEADTGEADDGAGTESPEEETYQPSEAEVEAAMKEAKKEADAKLGEVASAGELYENATSASVTSAVRDWLFDASRKEGDTTVIEDSAGNRYYVVAFEKRYLDETPTADVRVIITGPEDTDANTILEEWKNGEATEESFIELYGKYNQDATMAGSGGLYEALSPSGMDELMADWIFEEGRAGGDTTAITGEDGSHYVMYYVGQNDPQWKLSITNTLLTDILNEYLEQITEGYEVSDPKGNLNYLKVQASEATQESISATEGTEETGAADDPESENNDTAEESGQSTEATE